MSQHITGTTSRILLRLVLPLEGLVLQVDRDRRCSGNGVWMYIVSPMTSGEPSWPRSTPVDMVHATCSLPTLLALICLSSL